MKAIDIISKDKQYEEEINQLKIRLKDCNDEIIEKILNEKINELSVERNKFLNQQFYDNEYVENAKAWSRE